MIKSQRFYKYLFSYILLVIIPLFIMGGVAYQKFFNTLRGEVENSTIAALTQFRDTIDLRMNEMNRMAMQISNNPQLTPYMATDGGYGPYKAVEELRQYLSSNMFIHDIVVHFNAREPSQMFAASGTYDIKLFFNNIYLYKNWIYNDFLNTLTTIKAPIMRPMEPVLFNRIQTEEFATYMFPLPVQSATPYGAVMFLISGDAFKSLAHNVLGDYNGLLYVLNKKNEVFYRTAKGETQQTGERMLEEILKREPGWTINSFISDKRKFTAVKMVSADENWSYVAIVPSEQIMHKVNESRLLFYYAAAVVFILGVIMAFGFSIRQYKPLQRLARMVSSREPGIASGIIKANDELDYISSAVVQMARENEGLIHRLRSQSHLLREQALLSIIKGKPITAEELDDMLKFSQFRLDKPKYVVLLFLIDEYKKFRHDNTEHMQDVLKYSIVKVFEELLAEAGNGFGVELIDGRSIVFLLNLNDGFNDPEVLRELVIKAKQVYKQYFRYSITVGVGAIVNDYTEISRSFVEANNAARHRFVKGGDQVFYFQDIESDKAEYRWYPVEQVVRLVRAIKQGDNCEVETAVREAFRHIIQKNVSIDAAESICLDIVNNVYKTLIEHDIEIVDHMGETLERLFAPRYETMEELEHQVIETCSKVCQYIVNQKESKKAALLEEMKGYIETVYADHSITLDTIAERFGLSSSYATRFFKEQTGCPLMRYIDDLRMNKAKQMLETTNLMLKDIMAEVGYVDSTNFIRKFKKIEGVTPMKYRSLKKQ